MSSKTFSGSKVLAILGPIILALVGALWVLLMARVGDVEAQVAQVESRNVAAMERIERDIREIRADVKLILTGGSYGSASR